MPRRGFTLIELLVVIAVIGVLSAIVLAVLSDARSKSRDTSRVAGVKEVQKALQVYWLQQGAYPPAATPTSLSSLSTYLVPTYIKSIDYDMTGVSGATYYRPASNPDSYLIYVALERRTQVSPSAYGCRTGVGPVVDSGLYPSAPKCER
ncbi:MAG TPA: prepilin-type N-terminal cleavage/methylation domain-containing protein [Candidatus Paceibacterota bacterium]|jgi:prepilin-type N-terminal cleavage/methylation domain-containing protein